VRQNTVWVGDRGNDPRDDVILQFETVSGLKERS
jgi:hypothetical protein